MSSRNGRILRLIDEQTTCHIWRANDLILMEKYQNTQIPIDIDTSSEIQIIYAYTHFDHWYLVIDATNMFFRLFCFMFGEFIVRVFNWFSLNKSLLFHFSIVHSTEESCHTGGQWGPCGVNTKCEVVNGVPTCSCLRGYVGSPLSGCRHE